MKGGEYMKKLLVMFGTILTLMLSPLMSLQSYAQTGTPDLSTAHQFHGAHLSQLQVTQVSGTVITAFKDKSFYTVNTGSFTDFRRRYWGRTTIAQVSVGDYLNVWGRYTDSTNRIVSAFVIRDTSIQEAHDTFTGYVISTNSTGFVLQSDHRGQQTVSVNEDTKFVDKNGSVIDQGSIQTGDKVVVDGLWDRVSSTVGPAETVKDNSVPR